MIRQARSALLVLAALALAGTAGAAPAATAKANRPAAAKAKPAAKATGKPPAKRGAKPAAKTVAAAKPAFPCDPAARKVVPFTAADVSRLDPDGLSVSWRAPPSAGPVEVYASPKLGGAGGARVAPAVTGPGSVAFTPKTSAARWWFTLKPACGRPLTIAERKLRLQGASNFRDLGGYRTEDGRWVRMGALYRAGELSHLTDKDLKVMGALGIKTVADLRNYAQRSREPDKLPPKTTHAIYDLAEDAPIGVTEDSYGKAAKRGRYDRVLVEANRRFVKDPGASAAFGKLMNHFASGANPTVFHCTAGKDSTGWAAAVLLTALGVPRETVMADYMLSADLLAEKNRIALPIMQKTPGLEDVSPAQLESLLTVRRAYLQAAFDQVERTFGSFDAYLREGLGLTDAELEALRTRYLVGAAL